MGNCKVASGLRPIRSRRLFSRLGKTLPGTSLTSSTQGGAGGLRARGKGIRDDHAQSEGKGNREDAHQFPVCTSEQL